MKRPPVRLPRDLLPIALNAIVASLRRHGIEVIVVSLDDHHLHVLARFPDQNPRHWIGLAKKDSARLLSDRKLIAPGGAWAKRGKCLPVRDRPHQLSVVRYILAHARRPRRSAVAWRIFSRVQSEKPALDCGE